MKIDKTESSQKFLFFAPYGWWGIHNQVDAVLAKALEIRGCESLIIRCDGVFQDCPVIGRQLDETWHGLQCSNCHQFGETLFQSFGLPCLQLRTLITLQDEQLVDAWLDQLQPTDYANAHYLDLRVGSWVTSTIYTHFRIAEQGLSDPVVQKAHRNHLRDGLLTYLTFSRLVHEYNPCKVIIFNARFTPYRAAYEAARHQGIPTLVHERGFIDDSFSFFENQTCLSQAPYRQIVEQWQNIPLQEPELKTVSHYFLERELGRNTNWEPFYTSQTTYEEVRSLLRIPPNQKILVFFSSSEDELSFSKEWQTGISHLDFLERLIDIFKERDEYLVIRHHPHIGGIGNNTPEGNFLAKAYKQAETLPSNVRIIMPTEEITSYALLWTTDISLSFFSTVSIEAAARGVTSLVAQQSPYAKGLRFCLTDLDKPSLARLIDKLFQETSLADIEDLRVLYRFTYSYYFRFAKRFNSFGVANRHQLDIRIQSLDDLKPGKDPELDRLCDHLLDNAPLYPQPENSVNTYSTDIEIETTFLSKKLEEIQTLRKSIHQKEIDLSLKHSNIEGTRIALVVPMRSSKQEITRSWPLGIQTSRHRKIRVYPLTIQDLRLSTESLLLQVKAVTENYCFIAHDCLQYDEAFLSTGLARLTQIDSSDIQAIRFGVWIEKNGRITESVFTDRSPVYSVEEAIARSNFFSDPLAPLYCGLFRTTALVEILERSLLVSQIQGEQVLRRWVFERMNQDDILQSSACMMVVREYDEYNYNKVGLDAIRDEQSQISTPIALLIFNRPQLTARVLEILRQVRPATLLVVADGPRSDRPGEAALCQQTRAMIERVDWPCEILRHYADQNLGCRRRVASGLDWVFSRVERAIILEDDCLPDPSFFQFCEAMLDRYRDDQRVMAISGDNFQGDRPVTEDSYYFSRYPHIWGWATWRRAWQHYDLAMADWPALRDRGWLFKLLRDQASAQYWTNIFQGSYEGFDTWDYAWVFACWRRGGLTILPARNLVSNAGFGEQATHTKGDSPLANLPAETLAFPLRHPSRVVHCVAADDFSESRLFSGSSMLSESLEQRQWVDRAASLRQMLLQQPTLAGAYSALGEALDGLADHSAGDRARHIDQQLQQHYRDYIAPGLQPVFPDAHFPNLTLGDRTPIAWPYLRKEIPHNWYVDRRSPTVGFLSRDEAHLLYNLALAFQGQPALEIGCWMGWSACHLALAGVQLDVVDPLLGDPGVYQTVSDSLTSAGVRDRVNLVPGYSPQAVQALAAQRQQPWSLIFIDGNHERPGPLEDAMVCAQLAAPDVAIVFHDLASPDVAEGLDYLRQQGWNTMVYQTMQIMGVAWRGQVQPVRHRPDPSVRWELPAHLQSFMVSGISDGAIADGGLTEFQQWLPVVQPYTFLSEARLLSLYRLTKDICLADLPGNIVECGTCKGGAAALIAATIARYSRRPRKVYAFDTFEGMPDPTEVDRANGVPANDTGFGAGTLGAPIEQNLNVVCRALGVESIVVPVKGLFNQTLPVTRGQIGDIALLHADGDWYESTIDIFQYLYGQVIAGGAIQIDDYGHWEGCRKAIDDLQAQWRVQFGLQPIDYTGVWFRKDTAATPTV